MSTCWACGASRIGAAGWLAPLPFVECAACRFCFRPDLDESALHAEYAGGDYESDRSEVYAGEGLEDRRRDARVRLRFVAEHHPGGTRLLDVGAAGGAFVSEAAKTGFTAAGIEPSPETAQFARQELGVDVATGMVEDADLGEATLGVVTMWHVLEHLREPATTLSRIAAAIEPGGILALEVPNAASAIARRMGPAWPSLEPDVHVGQYGPRSVTELLGRAGLDPVWVGSVSIAAYYDVWRRWAPGQVVHWLRWGRRVGTLRHAHPEGHELLRAVGRRPQPD